MGRTVPTCGRCAKSRTDAPGVQHHPWYWELSRVRLVLRGIGWFLLAAGVVLLGRDLLFLLTEGRFESMALGFLWHSLHSSSLQLSEAVVSRYLHAYLWHPVIATVLVWPAFAVLGGLGALLVLLTRRRDRGDRIFAPGRGSDY